MSGPDLLEQASARTTQKVKMRLTVASPARPRRPSTARFYHGRRLLTSLLGDAQGEPQVRSVLIERLFAPRSQASANNIARAQAGGTLRPDVPPDIAIDLLVGPLFYRMFVQHRPVTDTFVRQVLRYVVDGLHPRAIATRRPGRRAG